MLRDTSPAYKMVAPFLECFLVSLLHRSVAEKGDSDVGAVCQINWRGAKVVAGGMRDRERVL